MSRPILAPKRRDVPADEVDTFDRVGTRLYGASFPEDSDRDDWSPGHGYYAALLHWPVYALNRADLSEIVRKASLHPQYYAYAEREFISMVISPYLKTNIVMKGHLEDTVASGVRLEAIEALRAGHDDQLTEQERLLATYIRQVVDGAVTDDVYDKVEDHFGVQGVVAFTVCITVIQMAIRQQQAFGVTDPSNEEIDAMIRDFRQGRREVPATWTQKLEPSYKGAPARSDPTKA
jgi:hypothetical protein